MLGAILNLLRSDRELEPVATEVQDLTVYLQEIRRRWENIQCDTEVRGGILRPEVLREGQRGRPRLMIGKEQIEFLRELRLSWTRIAHMYGISRRTLCTIRVEYGIVDEESFSDISDQELDTRVAEVKRVMPDAGQSMVKGTLRSQGIHVPVVRVRESVSRVDPINTTLRWATPICRRVYSVSRPNALWHVDGNLKLVRFVSNDIQMCIVAFPDPSWREREGSGK